MAVETMVEIITLNKAKAYLNRNVVYERGAENTNRPIALRTVNQFAVDMLKNNWRLTHQGIGFDTNDYLKDGQHRLMAIVQAGEHGAMDGEVQIPANPKISIKMMVTRGLDPDIFPFLDMGRLRSAGAVLTMAGYTQSTVLAAAARLIFMYDNYDYKLWNTVKVTNQSVLDVVKNTGIEAYISLANQIGQVGFIKPSVIAGCYIAERVFPDADHQTFLDGLATGVDLGQDSPVLALRNYMIRSRNITGVRRDARVHFALYFKAWNDFLLSRKRTNISYRTSEAFPKPLTKADVKRILGK